MAYIYPEYPPKTSGVPTPVSWNWSSPPQVNPPTGLWNSNWVASPQAYSQSDNRTWNWSTPPQAYPSTTSYAGDLRMVAQNGYGFQGELVRPRHSFQQPPLTSTPRPELYGNTNCANHGFYGMPDPGLTEVLASNASRRSTVLFMDSKVKRRGRLGNMRNRLLLLVSLLLIGVGIFSYWKAGETHVKNKIPNPALPTFPRELPEETISSSSIHPQDHPSTETNLPDVENNPRTIESHNQPPLTSTHDLNTFPELESNTIIKEPLLQSAQITKPTTNTVMIDNDEAKEDIQQKVIYAFDDDDRDLDNEARVEIVPEKLIIITEKPVVQKPESKNKQKENNPPRGTYPYPGPIPVMRKPGNRHVG